MPQTHALLRIPDSAVLHEQFVYYEIALSEHLSRARVSSLRCTTLGHKINALWNWPDLCRGSGGECA